MGRRHTHLMGILSSGMLVCCFTACSGPTSHSTKPLDNPIGESVVVSPSGDSGSARSESPTFRGIPLTTKISLNEGERQFDGRVVKVLDGDTIQLKDHRDEVVTVRLLGIDAPENAQPYGLDARDKLKRHLTRGTCTVVWKKSDRYGRILGNIYVDDRYVNLEMVKSGLAWDYTKYSLGDEFVSAEKMARADSIGIWREDKWIAPWDWRNGVREETTEPVFAPSIRKSDVVVYITRTGHKYHRQGCRHTKSSATPISLSRAASAYEPCKVCAPPTQ
jgi:micrococcal nuclease